MNSFSFNLVEAPAESYLNGAQYGEPNSHYYSYLPYSSQHEAEMEVLRAVPNEDIFGSKPAESSTYLSDFQNDNLFSGIKSFADNAIEIKERPEICIDSDLQAEKFCESISTDPSDYLSKRDSGIDANTLSMMKRLSGEHSVEPSTHGASSSKSSSIDVDKCLRSNSGCFSTAFSDKSFDLTSVVEEDTRQWTEEIPEKKSSANSLKPASKKISKKKRDLQVSTSKGRKTKDQMKLLLSYFHLYKGKWDDDLFGDLVEKTGFNKKQLNKWFWDRKKKVSEAIQAKKQSYPGLIFEVTNMETGMDLTPTFKRMCVNKPIFIVEKALF